MQESPDAVLGPKDAGDTEGNRGHFIASGDLRLESFDFEGVAELARFEFRKALELDGSAIAIVGCGSPSGFLDLAPAVGRRAERIRERGVRRIAVQLEESVRVSPRDLVQGSVARLDGLIEALGCCPGDPSR
jgi:hypothetical protein